MRRPRSRSSVTEQFLSCVVSGIEHSAVAVRAIGDAAVSVSGQLQRAGGIRDLIDHISREVGVGSISQWIDRLDWTPGRIVFEIRLLPFADVGSSARRNCKRALYWSRAR